MVNILSNPIILLLAATIIMTSLMFLFVGRKKKPKKKIEKVIKQQQEKKEEISEEQKTQKDDEFNEKMAQISQNFDKIDENSEENNNKKEKKISKVYIRKQSVENKNIGQDNDENQKYDELSSRAEFVLTSKKIAKFEKFSEENKLNEEVLDFKEDIENCDVCKDFVSHFDHSRRISSSVKNNNFDDLFASHITEHYLKIDAERHLSQDKINLFERADELVFNGQNRALDPDNQEIYNNLKSDKDRLKFFMEQNKFQINETDNSDREELANKLTGIDLKTLIMSDALLKRRSNKK